MIDSNYTIAVIGQGYVGLPLALSFSKYYPTIGYDIDTTRVEELQKGIDRTLEADARVLNQSISVYTNTKAKIGYCASSNEEILQSANIFIVTVPTPITEFNEPDLGPLQNASALIGKHIKKGAIVIYESTVYPGCTEEDCVPIIEQHSGLIYNKDFFVGYSPERINPGDKKNTLENIVKVTSGSTESAAEVIDQLYKKIIKAGTFKATSIKVAEAAKVIENAQRDVNISFVNEIALICDRVGIDTLEVLEAASTKFNFLNFKPGLVGGHCISVDPYYLSHKAIQLGYHPDVILSGRRVNDQIPIFIASKLIKMMIKKRIDVSDANVLVLGYSFKENCPDTRNTKVYNIYQELCSYDINVTIYDPWIEGQQARELGIYTELEQINKLEIAFDAVILATAHTCFESLDIVGLLAPNHVIYDTKGVLDKSIIDARL